MNNGGGSRGRGAGRTDQENSVGRSGFGGFGTGGDRGRGRGGLGNQNNRPGRGFGGGGNWGRRPHQRDLEGELLHLVNSDFQINCTDARPLEDIFHRAKQDPDIFAYLDRNIEVLRQFIVYYKENFSFDPDRPNLVRWHKEHRLAAKNDRKEPKREERRQWAKKYDEENVWYDPVHEQTILSFVLALFAATKEIWLKMDLVQKAVKQAFRTEGDLEDYVGGEVRAFLVRRDYLFQEHLDMLLFRGINMSDVVYLLNEHIRENTYQGNNRMPTRRLHDQYKTLESIKDEAREELRLDDPRDFCNFLKRCSWVFQLDADDTHVTSKRILLRLQYGRPVDPSLKEIVDLFRQMHRQNDREDDAPLDQDDLDEVYSGTGSLSTKRKTVASKLQEQQQSRQTGQTAAASGFADRAVQAANPFTAYKQAAQPQQQTQKSAVSNVRPPMEEIEDDDDDELDDDDDASLMVPINDNDVGARGMHISGNSTPPEDPNNLSMEDDDVRAPPRSIGRGSNPFQQWR